MPPEVVDSELHGCVVPPVVLLLVPQLDADLQVHFAKKGSLAEPAPRQMLLYGAPCDLCVVSSAGQQSVSRHPLHAAAP